MHITQMRNLIAGEYPGVGWKRKCREMSERQVIAIYHSFLEKGRFDKKKQKEKKQKDKDEGVQMTMYDFLEVEK